MLGGGLTNTAENQTGGKAEEVVPPELGELKEVEEVKKADEKKIKSEIKDISADINADILKGAELEKLQAVEDEKNGIDFEVKEVLEDEKKGISKYLLFVGFIGVISGALYLHKKRASKQNQAQKETKPAQETFNHLGAN